MHSLGVLCRMWIADFRKGVFCGISPVEILCGVRDFAELKLRKMFLLLSYVN